jgi:hypothetical protein
MNKDEPLGGMRARIAAVCICRLSYARALVLCNILQISASFVVARQHAGIVPTYDRHGRPRRLVYPDCGFPPSTMIERRQSAVFCWRFIFSGLRD